MAKLVLTSIGSRYGSIDALNANFQAIEEAFDNTLSLDGTVPNALEHELDAGSFRIINLATPTANSDAVTKQYVDSITGLLNSYVDEITTVANNITDVVTVADNIADVVAVAPNIALVAGALDEIEAVAQNIGSVELVGLDLNGAFISGVIYDFGSITEAPVGEAPTSDSNIVIVANDIADVTTVATNIASVTTVATNIADVNTAATNIVAIQNASTNATNAAASAVTASDAKDDAITAQIAAEAALAATLAAYDNFDDRYLGAKTSDPSLDNDGNALVAGSLYYNSSSAVMKVYTGSIWVAAYVAGTDFLAKANNLSDLTNTSTARTNLGLGSLATLSSVGTAQLAATLDYGSIV